MKGHKVYWRIIFAVNFFMFGLYGCENEEEGKSFLEGMPQVLGSISVQVPLEWIVESPSSSIRIAQYRLPRQGQDLDDALMAVFYFGAGQGGSVEANLERWSNQFLQSDGESSREKAKVERKIVSGMGLTLVDLKGTFRPSVMSSRTLPKTAKPGYRMLGGILDSPRGFYFFKLIGPEQTVEHWKESFNWFLGSVKSD